MLLSVYIITYNHEKFIAQAIESALMQNTDFKYEIVIGDDMSTDNTRSIIEDIIVKNPGRIRLISSDRNVGAKHNAVRTLKACTGKYIASLEGDDYWLSDNKLQKQVDFLEKNPDLSMCFTNRSIIDDNGNIIEKETIPQRFKRTLKASDIIGGFTPPTQTVVFRKDLLSDKVYTGLTKVFNGDSYAFSYFSTYGDVAYLDEVTACYRRNSGGVYSGSDSVKRLEQREITLEELIKILPENYRHNLDKGFNALNQRLYVLYLRNFNILKFMTRAFKLMIFDIKKLQFSFLKANRLLLKTLFNNDYQITD